MKRTGWAVTAEGDTVYCQAANERKAVEEVEAHFGVPPGALQMSVIPCPELPPGEQWVNP